MTHEAPTSPDQEGIEPLRDNSSFQDLIPELEAVLEESSPVLCGEKFDEFLDREGRNREVELVGTDTVPRNERGRPDMSGLHRLRLKASEVPVRIIWKEWFAPARDAFRKIGYSRYLTDEELDKALQNPTFHAVVEDEVNKTVVESEKDMIRRQAWWLEYDKDGVAVRNPFEDEATEQVVFGHDGHDINLYNFGSELTDWEVRDVQVALHDLDVMTNGLVFAVLKNIVVTDDLSERYFEVDDYTAQPDGLAHQGKGLISLRRGALSDRVIQHNESGDKSTLMKLIYHEVAHLIDGYIRHFVRQSGDKQLPASFDRYFDYKTVENEPKQEITSQRHISYLMEDGETKEVDMASIIGEDRLIDSKPTRRYGYTNSSEDFATAVEDLMIGHEIDPMRREAIMDILTYAAAEGNVYMEGRSSGSGKRRMHEEIYQPSKPLMAEPLRYIEDEAGLRVESAFPAMEVQHRGGDEIVYPSVDTSGLHRETKMPVYIDMQR